MGATGWQYTVPYQADVEKMLANLHIQEFEGGRYQHPGAPDFELLEEMDFFEVDEDEREEMIAQYGLTLIKPLLDEVGIDNLRGAIADLAQRPLTSLKDLQILRCFSFDGTGSILDIDNIAPESIGYGLYPLPKEKITTLLGTAEPTLEAVEIFDFDDGPDRLYERNEGFYIVTYRDGQPDKIYIQGCSGD